MQDSDKSVEQLNKLLQTKQLEVNSLLEATQAINSNLPTTALFRIYEFILRAQMGVEKLLVFLKEDQWNCISSYGSKHSVQEAKFDKGLLE